MEIEVTPGKLLVGCLGILVAGALMCTCALLGPGFVGGFMDGFQQGLEESQQSQTQPAEALPDDTRNMSAGAELTSDWYIAGEDIDTSAVIILSHAELLALGNVIANHTQFSSERVARRLVELGIEETSGDLMQRGWQSLRDRGLVVESDGVAGLDATMLAFAGAALTGEQRGANRYYDTTLEYLIEHRVQAGTHEFRLVQGE